MCVSHHKALHLRIHIKALLGAVCVLLETSNDQTSSYYRMLICSTHKWYRWSGVQRLVKTSRSHFPRLFVRVTDSGSWAGLQRLKNMSNTVVRFLIQLICSCPIACNLTIDVNQLLDGRLKWFNTVHTEAGQRARPIGINWYLQNIAIVNKTWTFQASLISYLRTCRRHKQMHNLDFLVASNEWRHMPSKELNINDLYYHCTCINNLYVQ